jgi:hypothetical protein
MSRKGMLCGAIATLLAMGAACAQDTMAPVPLDEYGAAPGFSGCDTAGCTNNLNASADIEIRSRDADGTMGFAVLAKPDGETATSLVQFVPFDLSTARQASNGSCRLNDRPVFDVVAVGTGTDGGGMIQRITRAWKLDASGRLAPADAAGLSCLADSQISASRQGD